MFETSRFSKLENYFILHMLDEHGKYLRRILLENLEERNIIRTGQLYDSIFYKTSIQGNNQVLSFYFEGYGRFLEIQSNKKSGLSKLLRNQFISNRDIWNIKQNRIKKTPGKNYQWYTKAAYRSQFRLLERFSTEFTEDIIEELKNIISIRESQNKY